MCVYRKNILLDARLNPFLTDDGFFQALPPGHKSSCLIPSAGCLTLAPEFVSARIGMDLVWHLVVQVNEKSCRLPMATYRDGLKRKGDTISHIVCMCIIMRMSKISLPN